jgi:uncharacterized protein YaiI (UPF0178 family)
VVVWVDADACPAPIKEIVFRAAERTEIETVVVANHAVRVPRSRHIRSLQVHSGFDVADARILEGLARGDLVITADVPLAAQAVAAGATALNPRGTLYTADNVGDHLASRNLMSELRSAGTVTGGPPSLSKPDIQRFANELDKLLTRHLRERAER